MSRTSTWYRVLSFLSGISMLVQPTIPLWNAVQTPVYAQDATESATPDPTPEPTPTVTGTEAPTPTETVSPTPEVTETPAPTDTVTPSVTPSVTETPTATPTTAPANGNSTQPQTQSSQPPSETGPPGGGEVLDGVSATPTPSGTPDKPVIGHLETTVLENVDADSLDLTSVDPSSATLTTDKTDYAPTDTAIISGTGFIAGTDYTLTIRSDDEPATETAVTVTADDQGAFVYAYQLDGTYRPDYRVTVTDSHGRSVAETSFTDSYTPVYSYQLDTAGANDEPGQKDLTQMGADYTQLPTKLYTTWNWDEIGWTGANTGDACNLFDTDGDGLANYSLCAYVSGTPAAYTGRTLYSCGDDRADRCTNPIATLTTASACNASVQTADPFPAGDEYPKDTVGTCEIPMSDISSAVATLIDVCSYPSGQPNSDPSDCIVYQEKTAKLEVKKVLDPASDPGKFNLSIDGTNYATDVGNGGTTGEQVLTVGKNGTAFAVSESAGTATALSDYGSTYICKDTNGTGATVASGSGAGPFNVTLHADDDVVCTFTNTRNQGTLIVRKVVVNDNGGTKTFMDFSFSVNGASAVAFEADGQNDLTVAPGTYTVTEPAVSGYATTYDNCTNVTVTSGGTATCTVTNNDQPGTLIVRKVVVNDNGGTKVADDFTYQVNGGTAITFEADGQNEQTVNAGTYTVTEPSVTGYATTYDNCTDVYVPNGGSATCTVTNNDVAATLIVRKVVVNDNGGTKQPQDFTFSVNGASAVAFEADGQNDLSVAAGTYTVTEPSVAGYATTYDNCTNVVITNGGTATCTVTNNDIAPTLTLIKTVVNDNGGTKQAGDFTLRIDGVTVISGVANPLSAGAHTASEIEDPAYVASGWGGDCSVNGSVTLNPGDNKTCTIVNDDKAASLTVIKHVVTDDGGTADASDFTMHVTGTDVSDPEFPGSETGTTVTLDAGSYGVSETGIAGYAASYSADCSGSIANGESKTCTVTNDDEAASLIVRKVVINDDGGGKQADDFTFRVNGGAATPFEADGQNDLNVSAGTYTVTEPAVAGYDTTYDNCERVTVGNGQTQICTVTNNDRPATLIVKKIVVNTHGGTAVADDFDFSVNGGAVIGFETDGQNDLVIDAGTYTITEPAVPGYETTYDNCSLVYIPNGGTETCTITNSDTAPELKLVKHVTNDNGGTKTAHDWTLTATGTGGFSDTGDSGTFHTVRANTGYVLSESSVTGYVASGWSCSGGSLQSDTISLSLGESVTCDITNDDAAASLTVIKHVINDNGGSLAASDFTMNVSGDNVSDSSFPGDETGTTITLDAGSYSVDEDAVAGYAKTLGADCSGRIANGESKTCTVTNDDIAPVLHLRKTVITDNGGTATADDFTLTADGTGANDVSGTSPVDSDGTLKADTFSLSETSISGYTASAWTCLGGVQNGDTVTLANGQEATCTIVNDDVAPRLTVIKHVINDNGGTAVASDFTMNVSGDNVSDSSFPGDETGTTVTVNEGSYDVTEDAVAGYAVSYSEDCTGSVKAGESKTCTVTNDDTHGTIIVTKFRDDDRDGNMDQNEPVLADFEMNLASQAGTVSKPTLADGTATFSALLPDTYTLTETQKQGYEFTGMYCIESEQSSVTNSIAIRLAAEETVRCYVGNRKLDPILTISKTNDAAGTKSPGSSVRFTITVTATQSAAYNVQVTDLTPPGFTYRSGSWTADSDVRGNLKTLGITTEPTYHSPGVWQLGDMSENETVTLTYLADISSDQKAGTYRDLAWAYGCKTDTACDVNDANAVLSMAVSPGFVDDNFVGTEVTVARSTQNTAKLDKTEGEVLGAATELPATGARELWLIIAALLVIAGAALIATDTMSRRYHA